MSELVISRPIRARKSYEARTGMNSRANRILVAAMAEKPVFKEDDNGNLIREWQKKDEQRFTNAQLADCLRNRVAVEPGEMLGTVPPTAIKYCVTKGWLVPNASASLYTITLKGAIDLDLPLNFKGGKHHGRKIPFANTTKAKVS